LEVLWSNKAVGIERDVEEGSELQNPCKLHNK